MQQRSELARLTCQQDMILEAETNMNLTPWTQSISLLQEGGGGGGGGWDKIVRNVGINALFLCGYFLIDGGGGFFGGGGGGEILFGQSNWSRLKHFISSVIPRNYARSRQIRLEETHLQTSVEVEIHEYLKPYHAQD